MLSFSIDEFYQFLSNCPHGLVALVFKVEVNFLLQPKTCIINTNFLGFLLASLMFIKLQNCYN